MIWHSFKTRVQVARKKVFNDSLIELTYSFMEPGSLLKLAHSYVQECLCYAVYSRAHLAQCGIWELALGDVKPCACIKVEAKCARDLSRLTLNRVNCLFNLKLGNQTQDVGQPVMQGGEKISRTRRLAAQRLQAERFSVAFLNQVLHVQAQTSHRLHAASAPPLTKTLRQCRAENASQRFP